MEPWLKPELTDIRMSAEIGGYQQDGEDPERDPLAEEETEAPEEAAGG